MRADGWKRRGTIGLSVIAIFFSLLWTGSPSAIAAEAPTTEAAPIFSLTVTAKRWIGSDNIVVLDLQALEAAGAVSVADALRMTPDIAILQYGRHGSPQRVGIRGTGAASALILVDGSPMPAGSRAPLFDIPLTDVERIEIAKSQPDAVYSGGVIHIVTKAAGANAASYVSTSGRFPERDMLVTESGAIGESELLLTAYHTTLPFGPAGAAERQRYVRIRLDREVTESTRASASIAWSLNEHGAFQSPGSEWESPALSGYDDVVVANVSYASRLPQGRFEARGFARLVHEDLDPHDLSAGKNDFVVGAEVEAALGLGSGEVVLGGGARRESGRGGELAEDGLRFDIATLFARLSQPLGAAARVSVGAHADLHSSFEPVVSPSVGISLQALPQTLLKASAAHAFRPPTMNEWRMQMPGEADLRPEKGWRYEVGLSQSLGWGSLGVDLFREQLADRIHLQPDAGGVTRPENVAASITRGVDLTMTAPLGDSVSTSVKWRLVDDRDGDGARLPYVPSQEVRLGLGFIGAGTHGNFELQLLGPRLNGAGSTLPTLAVANGRIVHAASRDVDLFAEGYNLFDAQESEGAPSTIPGRTFMLGASLSF